MTEPPVAVVLTALEIEYNAVREHLVDLETECLESGTRYEIGTVRGTSCRVVIGQTGAGNKAAAILAERAISTYKPVALLFSGVGGALRDSIQPGDVVVGSKIYAYQSAAGEDDGLKARPESWKLGHRVSEAVREMIRQGEWAKRLTAGSRVPSVKRGPIAAGEVVQKSRISDEARWVKQHYNDAAAIEMEGAGVAEAGHLNDLPVAVVRGISDRADGDKTVSNDDHWQPLAAGYAAAFAIELAVQLIEGEPDRASNAGRRSNPSEGVVGHDRFGGRGNTFNFNSNSNSGTVGIQATTISGGTVNVATPGGVDASADTDALLAELRTLLEHHHEAGDVDGDTYEAARRQLEAAESLATQDDQGSRTKVLLPLKMFSAAVSDVTAIAAKAAEAINHVKGLL